jgi:ATP-dependent RNA helicase DHX8/PRP22
MLSVESIFYSPLEKRNEANKQKIKLSSVYGDHITLLKIYNEFVNSNYDKNWCLKNYINYKSLKKVINIRNQLIEHLVNLKFNYIINKKNNNNNLNENINENNNNKYNNFNNKKKNKINNFEEFKFSSAKNDYSIIRKCLTFGFFLNSARKIKSNNKKQYKIFGSDQIVKIHPSSVLKEPFPEYIIFNVLVKTSNEYLREVTSVDENWLIEANPDIFSKYFNKNINDLNNNNNNNNNLDNKEYKISKSN